MMNKNDSISPVDYEDGHNIWDLEVLKDTVSYKFFDTMLDEMAEKWCVGYNDAKATKVSLNEIKKKVLTGRGKYSGESSLNHLFYSF